VAAQNQGNTNKVYGSFAYDNATYIARQSAILAVNSAGSGSLTGKFYAHCALTLWGVTFCTIAAGTSTYTVNGTATNPATSLYAIYITNTNTTGTALTLGTTTIGATTLGFVVGGTSSTGANVNVGGFAGGVAGGVQGPYSINTLGGTNTTFTWGLTTFTANPPGGANAGLGGLPMAIGDVLYFVNGTDATATTIPVVHFTPQFGAVVPI
jgi:hypothetical protein